MSRDTVTWWQCSPNGTVERGDSNRAPVGRNEDKCFGINFRPVDQLEHEGRPLLRKAAGPSPGQPEVGVYQHDNEERHDDGFIR